MNFENKKVLITAYSHSGNTRDVAKKIVKAVGGTYKPIIPKEAYPKSYTEVLKASKVEIEIKKEPELEENIDISDYDVIFVGTPNWYSTIAPPVRTVLMQNDFAGKTIVPFCTHGGGGKAKCLSTIAELAKGAKAIQGLAVYNNNLTRDELEDYLNNIKQT